MTSRPEPAAPDHRDPQQPTPSRSRSRRVRAYNEREQRDGLEQEDDAARWLRENDRPEPDTEKDDTGDDPREEPER